ETLGSRMVLMFTNSESDTDVTAASIQDAPMTLLRREKVGTGTASNTQEVWAILDADLPSAQGSYDASFTGGDNSPAMCLVAVSRVEQGELAYNGSAALAVGGSTGTSQGVASTTLTVARNNALLLSSVSTGADGTTYSS